MTRNPGHELIPYGMYEESRIDLGRRNELYRELAMNYPGHPVIQSIFFSIESNCIGGLGRLTANRPPDPNRLLDDIEKISTELRKWAKMFHISVSNNFFLRIAADEYLFAKRQDLILRRYPELQIYCARALFDLGKYDEVLSRYPRVDNICADALIRLRRFGDVIEKYPYQDAQVLESLIRLGRYREILIKYRDRPAMAVLALKSIATEFYIEKRNADAVTAVSTILALPHSGQDTRYIQTVLRLARLESEASQIK